MEQREEKKPGQRVREKQIHDGKIKSRSVDDEEGNEIKFYFFPLIKAKENRND